MQYLVHWTLAPSLSGEALTVVAQAFNLSNGREGDPSPPQRNIGERLFPKGTLLDGDKSRPCSTPLP